MRNKNTFLLLLIILVFGCTKEDNRKADHIVSQPAKQPVYFMAGKIEARNKVDVTSSFSATILHLNARIGDHVKKGETLLSLDRKEIQAQLMSLQKSYDNAKLNFDRTSNLMEKGYVSGQQQETLESQVKQTKAALEVATIQMEKGTIDSPIDGIVSAVNVNEGETPSNNTVLLSIVNSSHIYVKAYIPESLLSRIVKGLKVELLISENSDHLYHGVISMIDPVIDSKSKTALVEIEAIDFDQYVKLGMMVLVGTVSNRSKDQ